MASPFLSPFIEQFKLAAAEGAVVELKLRILCEAVRGLGDFAHTKSLENVEGAVIAHFRGDLAEGDAALLQRCRQLRNKILHGDFRAAREKLRETGAALGPSAVWMLKVDETRGVAEQDRSALDAGAEKVHAVADTGSTANGTIFGWLLELGIAGHFVLAANTFRGAVEVIDRLATLNAERETATVRGEDT